MTAVDAQTFDIWVYGGNRGISSKASAFVAAVGEDLAAAPAQEDAEVAVPLESPSWQETDVARRCEGDRGERKLLSNDIAYDRRRLRRKAAVARFARNTRPMARIRPHHFLQTGDGAELVGPGAAVLVVESLIADKYGFVGSSALWARV